MIDVQVVAQRSFIDGAWRIPRERLGVLCDPNTGAVRAPQLAASLADVDDVIRAASDLYTSDGLDGMGAGRRASVLNVWADQLDAHAEQIAQQDAISTGNPLQSTRTVSSFLGDRVRSLAQHSVGLWQDSTLEAGGRIVRLLNRPLGPTLVLAPWNAPTFVAVAKVAAAIGAASPVILKPSEWAPSGPQLAFELLQAVLEDAGFPPATAQLVHGGAVVGAALTQDHRIGAITFTGGLTAGRAVAHAAAETLAVIQLELGSNNPVIVLPDADLRHTARELLAGVTRLNGQWCEAPGKVLVMQQQHDDLVDALRAEIVRLRLGHCLEETTQLGPLAYERHRTRLESQLANYAAAGAQIHREATLPALDGWFFSPAIVTGLDASEAVDEMFGPALTVHGVDSVDTAIVAANQPGVGLDGYVFGRDESNAVQVGSRIRAGEIRINGTHMADLADGSAQTFWGTTGVGGHGPEHGVAFSQGRRIVGVDSAAHPI